MNGSFDSTGLQFVWDSTSLKLADECPRKYYYKMIRNLEPATNTNVHLRFGKHYATALEHYHQHVHSGMSHDDALDAVVHEALCDTWDGREDDALDTGAPWDSTDNNKNRQTLIRTIVWYLEEFKDDPAQVIIANDQPAVELTFKIEADNGIFLAGHLDKLVTYAGDPYVMDQKTSKSTITAWYFKQYLTDIQMSMYTFAGKVAYNTPVKGVIIDAAQIAVGFSAFHRGFVSRSEDQLNEWYDQTLELIEFTRELTREAHFPMRRTACNNFGGCPFREVCGASPAVRENIIRGDFREATPWDPSRSR